MTIEENTTDKKVGNFAERLFGKSSKSKDSGAGGGSVYQRDQSSSGGGDKTWSEYGSVLKSIYPFLLLQDTCFSLFFCIFQLCLCCISLVLLLKFARNHEADLLGLEPVPVWIVRAPGGFCLCWTWLSCIIWHFKTLTSVGFLENSSCFSLALQLLLRVLLFLHSPLKYKAS